MSSIRPFHQLLCALLLAASAGLLTGSACDRMRSDDAEPPARQEDGALPTKGESCSSDVDCGSYLRCRSETCRVPPAMEGEPGPETPRVQFSGADAEFYVELATTQHERSKGLMYRPEMQEQWGMLFIFDGSKKRSFWMKDTLIPLDMIFMDESGEVVNIIHEAEPETTTARNSEGAAKYVLELNGGTARDVGLEAGAQMEVENIPDTYAPRR